MKKTKLLTLTALTLIGLLGLSSCGEKGEKGDTGATGPAGETGPKGDKGDPGENGEDGKDGATWLTGTSKPADTLGNLGDMYLNTTNGDVYQKEESGWTLKMNIKGEDGEDGEDGRPGLNGSQGSQGETAYSNTILPSEGGYVIPSVGSATSGSSITFYIHTNKGYSFESLELNDSKVTTLTYDEDGVGSYETTMPTNGFVVKANFVNVGTGEDVELDTSYFKDGYIYTEATLDAAGNVISSGTKGSKMFESGSGTESDPLVVKTLDQFNKIDDKDVVATPAVNFEIAENIKTTEALPIEKRETTILDLGTHTLTVDSTTADQVEQTKVGGGETEQTLVLNGEDGSKLVYNYGVNNGGGSRTAIYVDGKGSVEVNNVDLESDGVPIAMFNDAASVSVSGSTVVGGNYGLSTNAKNGVNQNMSLEIKDSIVTAKNKGSAAVMFNVPGTLTISSSTIEGGRQGVFARVGSSKISKSTIIFAGDKEAIKYESQPWETGADAPSAAILVGNNSSNSGYQAKADLTLEDVTLIQKEKGSDAEGSSLLADETEPTKHEFKLLYAHGYNEDTKVTIDVDSLTMDKIAGKYCFNEHVDFKLDGQNVKVGPLFKDGNYYESATYLEDSEGNKTFLAGEVTTEKMFDGGDGSKEHPLEISEEQHLANINALSELLKTEALHFSLTKDLDLSSLNLNRKYVANNFNGVFDGNNHVIKGLSKFDYIFNYVYGETTFKNFKVEISNGILTRVFKNDAIVSTQTDKKIGSSVVYTTDTKKLGITFDNVDYSSSDDLYYDIGGDNQAIYFPTTNGNCIFTESGNGVIFIEQFFVNGQSNDYTTYKYCEHFVEKYSKVLNCDVDLNLISYSDRGAVFFDGQEYFNETTISNSSYDGNFIGNNVGLIYCNYSGFNSDNYFKKDTSKWGGDLWGNTNVDNVVLKGTLTGSKNTSITFANNALELEGTSTEGGSKVVLEKDSTLAISKDENKQFVITAATNESVSKYRVMLKLGKLDWYDETYQEYLGETSDFKLLVDVDASNIGNTGIYESTPLSLKQAIEQGLLTDNSCFISSPSGYNYKFLEKDGKHYIVIDFESAGFYQKFANNSSNFGAEVLALDENNLLVARA